MIAEKLPISQHFFGFRQVFIVFIYITTILIERIRTTRTLR